MTLLKAKNLYLIQLIKNLRKNTDS